jgi:tRNA nucleotidyltransferase/poly(A) polymerase
VADPSRLEDVARAAARVAAGSGRDDLWLVGGAVRDLLLGRPVLDWDFVVPEDPRGAARALARACGGVAFPLSERHGAWRVQRDAGVIDVTRRVGTQADDLARRDLTVNAVAVRLADASVLDPHGGLADLEARRLRAVRPEAFRDDPLRLLRLPRLAAELEFAVDEATATLARRDAHLADAPAGERQLAELHRLLATRDPIDALGLADRLGVLGVVLPEITALHDVPQNDFHHLDVFDHTVHVLDSTADIAAHVEQYFPSDVLPAVVAALDAPLDGSLDVRLGLRWAALFHDVAKPWTRTETTAGVKFIGHSEQGAAVADAALGRLRAGTALRRFCAVLVREHLSLGFLIGRRPLDARSVYRYALATAPWTLPSLVLSLGDRLATRGARTRLRGLRRHQEAAVELARGYLALGAVPPRPLVPGDVLAQELGLRPGPELGRLVAAVLEEQAAGTVTDRAAAVAFGRRWLQEHGAAS